MAAELFIPPSKALDANANPYAGAKWFFYATGTTTPQSVYTTFAMGTAHANPVVADSTGKFANIFFDPALVYRGVLKNADESVTLHDIDPISSSTLASLAASGGSALVGFLQAGAGAVARTLQSKGRDHVSVMDFGAVGDGVVDDTAAIQAAVNYIKSVTGGVVVIPRGNYKITASVNITGNFGFEGIEIRGLRATINSTHNGNAFVANPGGISSGDAAEEYRQNTLIHGLVFQGPGKANTSSAGVKVQQGANVQVRDCTIQGFYRGLHGYGALICNFHNLLIQDNEYGIDMQPTIPVGGGGWDPQFFPNDIHFYDIQLIDNIKAVRCTSFPAGTITFTACEIEGNNLAGNAADGNRCVEFIDAGKVTMVGCHLEENPGQYNLYYNGNNSHCHLNLIGCEIIPGDFCGTAVHLGNDNGVAQAANAFITGTRITTNVGNQLFITEGFKVTIIGSIFGGIQGNIEKLNYFKDGHLGSGIVDSAFAQIKAVGSAASNVAIDWKGFMRAVDAGGSRLGYIIHTGTVFGFIADTGSVLIGTNGGLSVSVARSGTATFEPNADNTYSLGTASRRWAEVFAGNAVINTSDGRVKQQVRKLSEAESAVAVRCKSLLRAFKFNDAVEEKGDAARIHFGVIAQDVKAAFEAEGLAASDYGLFCYDEWDDYFEDVLDDNMEPTGERKLATPAGNRYGIRYEQLLAFIIAAL